VGINFAPGFLNVEADKKRQALWEDIVRKHGLPADYREALKADPEKKNRGWAEFETRGKALDKERPPVDVITVVDHIDHIIKVSGSANHVGLGSDFDGIGTTPVGLEDVGKLGAVTAELLRRGTKESDVRKILGENFLRVFGAVERAAKR
jgi:membrane dipeptidase